MLEACNTSLDIVIFDYFNFIYNHSFKLNSFAQFM